MESVSLPDEILAYILALLDAETLILVIPLVCHQWRRVLETLVTCPPIVYPSSKLPLMSVITQRLHKLSHVTINTFDSVAHQARTQHLKLVDPVASLLSCDDLPLLKSIEIEDNYLHQMYEVIIAAATNLQEFSVSCESAHMKVYKALGKAFLKRLTIHHDWIICMEIDELWPEGPQWNALTFLDIGGCIVTAHTWRGIQRCTSLKTLLMDNTDGGALDDPVTFPCLQTLSLIDSKLQSEWIGKLLNNVPVLRCLRISDDIDPHIDTLRGMRLESLDFTNVVMTRHFRDPVWTSTLTRLKVHTTGRLSYAQFAACQCLQDLHVGGAHEDEADSLLHLIQTTTPAKLHLAVGDGLFQKCHKGWPWKTANFPFVKHATITVLEGGRQLSHLKFVKQGFPNASCRVCRPTSPTPYRWVPR